MDENRKETANRTAEDAARQALPTAPPQTDGDDIYHTKYIDFKGSAYDPRGMEQWLAERAAEGDELVRWEQFREGEKRDCRFYLEPAAEKGDPDELLRRKRESLGWEYVCTTKNDLFYIWRGDLSAHIPMPREQMDSYGYRLVCKKLRRSYGMPLFYAAADAVLFYVLYRVLTLPVLSLLVMPKSTVWQFASILLGSILGMLSGTKERGDLRALKRAMEEREHVQPAGKDRWSQISRVLSIICGVAALLSIMKDNAHYGDAYDEPPLPYLCAEELGGSAYDWCDVRDFSTPLGGHVYSVGETPYAGKVDDWWQYSTEVDFYAPRISALATPLTQELRDYFMEENAQRLTVDGFDEAYCAANVFYRYPNSTEEENRITRQFLLLRRGGEVLYFRTEAPDDLREHLDEFADIFNQYSELA